MARVGRVNSLVKNGGIDQSKNRDTAAKGIAEAGQGLSSEKASEVAGAVHRDRSMGALSSRGLF